MSQSGSFYWCWMQLADLLISHGGHCNATGIGHWKDTQGPQNAIIYILIGYANGRALD